MKAYTKCTRPPTLTEKKKLATKGKIKKILLAIDNLVLCIRLVAILYPAITDSGNDSVSMYPIHAGRDA
jgi:hypothetical protein